MAEIKKISTELQLLDKFLDTSGDAGTSGQVLTSTGTGINWVSGGSLPGGPYLPLAGGTITGNLTVNGTTTLGNQLTFPYGYLSDYIYHTGDSNTYFGFVSNDNFIVATSGAERMRINGSGNVGIGTTAPTSSVHINGLQTNSGSTSAHLPTGTMRLNFAGASSADEYGASLVFTQRWWTNSTGEVAMGQIAGVKETGNGNYGGGLAFFTSNNTSNNLLERLRINELGNVGIGTTSPSEKLHVVGDELIYGNLYLESTSNSFRQIAMNTSDGADNQSLYLCGGGTASAVRGAQVVVKGNEVSSEGGSAIIQAGRVSTGDIIFKTGVTVGERIRITSAGNVGIGVTTTDAKLQIDKANANSSVIISRSGTNIGVSTDVGSITFPSHYNSSYTDYAAIQAYSNALSAVRGSLDLKVKSTSGNLLTGLTVYGTSSGVNVGIGTISPDAILETSKEVAGNQVGALLTNTRQAGTADSVSLNFGLGRTADGFIFNTPAIKFLKEQQWTGTGSTVDGSLVFSTIQNETVAERMRIFSNGNVNIGVAETGSSAVTGPFVVTHSSSRFLTSSFEEGTVSLSAKNNNNNLESLRLAGDSIKFFNGTNTVGSQKMVILSNGNVGIGATGPSSKLQVEAAAGQATTLNNSVANSALRINADTVNGSNNIRIGESGSGSYFLQVSNSAGTTPYAINLNPFGGNVGIGTTSPSERLSVDGNAEILKGDDARVYIKDVGDSSTILLRSDGVNTSIGTDSNHDLQIQTNGSTKMYIESGGNVGIGTTNPSTKLHVNGTNASVGTIGTPKNDWYTTAYNGIQIGDGTTLWGRATDSHFSGNYYVKDNSGAAQDTYINTLSAHDLWLDNSSGSLKYRNAGLGSAGSAISWNTRFVVLTNGNFGIGTTSPGTRLDVNGATNIKGTVNFQPVLTLGTAGAINAVINTADEMFFNIDSDNNQTGAAFWFGHNSTVGNTASNLMIIKDSGRVGIGTTGPGSLLSLQKDDNTVYDPTSDDGQRAIGPTILLNNNSTTTNTFGQIMYDTDSSGQGVARIVFLDAGTASSAIAFVTEQGNSIGERMRITSAGGISFGSTGTAYGTSGQVLTSAGNASPTWTTPTTGTVTSITKGAGLVVAGSPITTTGSVAVEYAANVNNIITGGNNFIGDTAVLTDQILITDPGVTSTNRRVGNIELGDLPFLPFSGGTMTGAIIIPEYITHAGDTDTKFGFTAANQFQVIAGGNTNLNVQGNGVDLSYAGSTRLTTQTGGIAITGDLTVTAEVGIGLTNPDVPLHVTANEDGSGIDKGAAKFINTNTGQGATTMHMVQTSSSNFANAVKFWQGSTPTAVGFIRLTTSATQFITSASDLNLKKNITNWSDDTLSKFKALEPKKFRFKTQDVSEDKTLGFIAQNEVDNFPEAYPQFLGDDEQPYYGFNPTGMVPHLMKAIKDLVEKVETLENRITQLENNN